MVETTPPEHDFSLEQILERGRHPHSWLYNYNKLRRGADVLLEISEKGSKQLWDSLTAESPPTPDSIPPLTSEESAALLDSDVGEVSFYLLALAVECMCKAALIRGGGEAVDNKGNLLRKFKTHNLRQLAKAAGLEANKDDLEVLALLQRFLDWRGRYPIPTNWKDFDPFVGVNLLGTADVHSKAHDLCDRIWGEFEKNAPKG